VAPAFDNRPQGQGQPQSVIPAGQTFFTPPGQQPQSSMPAGQTFFTPPGQQPQSSMPAGQTFFTPPGQSSMAPADPTPRYVEVTPAPAPKTGLLQRMFGSGNSTEPAAQRVYVSSSQSPTPPAMLPPVISADGPPPGPQNIVMPQTYYPQRNGN
jgi:hypothetical protein